MRCGNTAIEIVDLHGVGSYTCGNKNKFNIRTGWDGKTKCKCDNYKMSMNCLVNNKMIGGYDHISIPMNIHSVFQYLYYHKTYVFGILIYILFILLFIFILFILYFYRKNLTKFIINI